MRVWATFAILAGCGAPDPAVVTDARGSDVSAVDAGSDASASIDAAEPAPDAGPCNGHPTLCDRGYDEVAYPTSHNSMASADEGFLAPNHQLGLGPQLDAGVRGFMLDVYAQGDQLHLCHSDCRFGSLPLEESLSGFRVFLEAHPREVVTLILESYAEPDRVAAAFLAAGLEPFLHTQAQDTPWPTLGAMVASGRRLVVLSDEPGGPAWHHDVWAHCGETHWHFESLEAMDCAPNRGRSDPDALFILNHFVTNPIAWIEFAEEANANPFFEGRALRCAGERRHIPNFVAVDFWSEGALFAVVDRLNEVHR